MDHNVKCQLCVFEARSIPLVLSHLRSVHSSDPGFNVTCGVQGCARTFTRFSTLYQHIYRHHNVPGIVEPRKKKFLVDSQTPDESSIAASVDHGLNHGGHMDCNGTCYLFSTISASVYHNIIYVRCSYVSSVCQKKLGFAQPENVLRMWMYKMALSVILSHKFFVKLKENTPKCPSMSRV